MREALRLAAAAGERGEVPVGAVLLAGDTIVAAAANDREATRDPMGHAEMRAIALGAQALGRWRLSGTTLVVTLEPCPMCAGAIVNARVDRLVVGAMDRKAGAAGSVLNIVEHAALNHRVAVSTGVLAEQSAQLLRAFFAERRKTKRA